MYNYFLLIGYVSGISELRVTSSGAKVITIFLRVRRDFKDATTGLYNWDTVKITAWELIAEIASDTVKKGSKIIAIGRVKPSKITNSDNVEVDCNELYADRLTVLADPTDAKNHQAMDEELDG